MKKGLKQEWERVEIPDSAGKKLAEVIEFLQIFMPVTLARRLVAILLLAIGMPVEKAVELTGLCERRMWTLKKEVREKPAAELLVIQKGSGRKSKCTGIEEAIVEELETNNYHTRQQIADMIEEKFRVKLSCSAVGDLLKKRNKKAEKRLASR